MQDEFEDPGGKENSPLAQSPQKDASPLAQSPQGGFSDRRDSPRQDSPSDDGNEKATSEVGQDSVGQREEEKEEKEEFKPAAQKKKAAKAKEAVDELDAEDDGMGEVTLAPPVLRNKAGLDPRCPVCVLSGQGRDRRAHPVLSQLPLRCPPPELSAGPGHEGSRELRAFTRLVMHPCSSHESPPVLISFSGGVPDQKWPRTW